MSLLETGVPSGSEPMSSVARPLAREGAVDVAVGLEGARDEAAALGRLDEDVVEDRQVALVALADRAAALARAVRVAPARLVDVRPELVLAARQVDDLGARELHAAAGRQPAAARSGSWAWPSSPGSAVTWVSRRRARHLPEGPCEGLHAGGVEGRGHRPAGQVADGAGTGTEAPHEELSADGPGAAVGDDPHAPASRSPPWPRPRR